MTTPQATFGYGVPQYEVATRYVGALQAWRCPHIADAAATIGMSQREYCDRYIQQFPPLMWTGTTTGLSSGSYVTDEAYLEALKRLEGTNPR